MLEIAFGNMELSPDEFYKMSWREFFLLCRGRKKKQDREVISQATFTREIAYQIYCSIPLGKNKKHISKAKYWSLPADKEQERKNLQKMHSTMEALLNKNK